MKVKREHEMRVAGLFWPPTHGQVWVWNVNCWGQTVSGFPFSAGAIWNELGHHPAMPSVALLEAAAAVGDGRIGPDLPPYRWPRHKPTSVALDAERTVWRWYEASRQWRTVYPEFISDGQGLWWWPASDWSRELYGVPVGDPTKGE